MNILHANKQNKNYNHQVPEIFKRHEKIVTKAIYPRQEKYKVKLILSELIQYKTKNYFSWISAKSIARLPFCEFCDCLILRA